MAMQREDQSSSNSHMEVPQTSLWRSLRIQMRVIHALFLREVITRYGRHGLGVLWLVLEPMIFTLGVAALWYFVKGSASSDIPIIPFAITGYSSVLMWRNAANRCGKAIEPNLSLMYHRNVKVIDVFFARILLEWVGATTSLIILTVFFTSIGVMDWPQDPWPIVAGWVLLAWFSLALGFIIGALSELSETFDRIWHVFTYILFPLSGAVFMVHWLPPAAQEIILKFPMVHGVELIRKGFFGDVVPTYGDIGYFATVNLVMTFISLLLIRDISKRMQAQ